MIWPRWCMMSKRQLQARGDAGRSWPKKSIVPPHRSAEAESEAEATRLCPSRARRRSSCLRRRSARRSHGLCETLDPGDSPSLRGCCRVPARGVGLVRPEVREQRSLVHKSLLSRRRPKAATRAHGAKPSRAHVRGTRARCAAVRCPERAAPRLACSHARRSRRSGPPTRGDSVNLDRGGERIAQLRLCHASCPRRVVEVAISTFGCRYAKTLEHRDRHGMLRDQRLDADVAGDWKRVLGHAAEFTPCTLV